MRRSIRDISGRARRWMYRQRATRALVADGPASPADGGWGGPLLNIGALSGPDTTRDSAAATALEGTRALTRSADANTPWNQIATDAAEDELRASNRHGWFAVLAHRHVLGDNTAADQAVSAMSNWLATDIPGRGPGWVHTTDLVARLTHWSIGVGWLQDAADADFRRRMAGAAQHHLEHLDTRLDPLTEGDMRRPLQLCGLIIGGLSWPGLVNADARWSDALAALPNAVEAQLYADGVDKIRTPDRLLDLLVHLFATRAVCVHNQVGFPRTLDGAIARATTYLNALADTDGALPDLGASYPFRLLDLDGATNTTSLSQAAQSLGLIAPEEGPASNTLFAASFGQAIASDGGNALVQPTTEKTSNIQKRAPLKSEWSLRAFREGRIFIAQAEVKKQLSRLIVDAGIAPLGGPHAPTPMHMLWWIGETRVLADPGVLNDTTAAPNQALELSGAHNTLQVNGQAPIAGDPDPQIRHARVDGRVMRITAERESRDGLWSHRRDINARQARLTITDIIKADGSIAVELNWQLGPGWEWERTDKGLQATNEGLKLLVKLDARLDWSVREGEHNPNAGWVSTNGTAVAAPALFGHGTIDSDEPIKTIFEIR